MDLTLHIWRQKNRAEKGRFVRYRLEGVSTHSSFLEMLDLLNERLTEKGEEPVAGGFGNPPRVPILIDSSLRSAWPR